MSEPGIKELLEAGLHFGHQTRRWDPRMRPLHLRGARRDPHHRPAADRAPARRGDEVRRRGGQQGRNDPVRGHQEAGPRLDQGVGGPLRDAVREPALAGRPADQLQHDVRPDRPAARADRPARRGTARAVAHQGADGERVGAGEARVQPRRRARDEAAAAGGADHRPEDRGDRGAGGRAPADPDHRARGLQRRSGADRLPDPGQRRFDPLRASW